MHTRTYTYSTDEFAHKFLPIYLRYINGERLALLAEEIAMSIVQLRRNINLSRKVFLYDCYYLYPEKRPSGFNLEDKHDGHLAEPFTTREALEFYKSQSNKSKLGYAVAYILKCVEHDPLHDLCIHTYHTLRSEYDITNMHEFRASYKENGLLMGISDFANKRRFRQYLRDRSLGFKSVDPAMVPYLLEYGKPIRIRIADAKDFWVGNVLLSINHEEDVTIESKRGSGLWNVECGGNRWYVTELSDKYYVRLPHT